MTLTTALKIALHYLIDQQIIVWNRGFRKKLLIAIGVKMHGVFSLHYLIDQQTVFNELLYKSANYIFYSLLSWKKHRC